MPVHEEPFVPGTLEPLLDHGNLQLACKRAVACVNREARRVFTVHLRKKELHVNCLDCTLANARFVIQRLVPAVDGLLLCAAGEILCPRMSMKQVVSEPRLRLHSQHSGSLGATAAFFLGHVLADADCLVRLTTGSTKCLKALREKPRLHLSPTDVANIVDQRVMAGALQQNALRRIEACGDGAIILANLYLTDEVVEAIASRFCAVSATLASLDLQRNLFAGAGIRSLLNSPGTLPPMLHLRTLCFNSTPIGSAGLCSLASAIQAARLPALEDLMLSDAGVDGDGIEFLAPCLRTLPTLKMLDLSSNPLLGETAVDALLHPDNLPLPKLAILNLLECERISKLSWKRLAFALQAESFPNLQQLCASKTGASRTLRKALKALEANRAWRDELQGDEDLKACSLLTRAVY